MRNFIVIYHNLKFKFFKPPQLEKQPEQKLQYLTISVTFQLKLFLIRIRLGSQTSIPQYEYKRKVCTLGYN